MEVQATAEVHVVYMYGLYRLEGLIDKNGKEKIFGLTLFEVICDQSFFLAKFIIEKSRLNSVNLTMTATELSLNDLLSPQSTTGDYE